jgi:hypothetical protein
MIICIIGRLEPLPKKGLTAKSLISKYLVNSKNSNIDITIHKVNPLKYIQKYDRIGRKNYFDQNIIYAHCWQTYGYTTNWFLNIDLDEKPKPFLSTLNNKETTPTVSQYLMSLNQSKSIVNIPRVRYINCNQSIIKTNSRNNSIINNFKSIDNWCRLQAGVEYQKSAFRPGGIRALDVHLVDKNINIANKDSDEDGLQVHPWNNFDLFIDNYNGLLIEHKSTVLSNIILETYNQSLYLIKEKFDITSNLSSYPTSSCNNIHVFVCTSTTFRGKHPIAVEYYDNIGKKIDVLIYSVGFGIKYTLM